MSTTPIPAGEPGRRAGPARHPCYEYYVAETDRPFPAEDLDALGSRSWRLAAIVKYDGLLTYPFLRRPSRSAPP